MTDHHHDPALAQWMDEHRKHALALTQHLVHGLYVLPDHNEHALNALVAERVAIGKAAAEVTAHLESVNLQYTALWLRYLRLARQPTQEIAEWRAAYRKGGGEAVRQLALAHLESAAHDLENPNPEPSHPFRHGDTGVELLAWRNQNILELLDHARENLATLTHHPHDEQVRAAAHEAWSSLTEQVQGQVTRFDRIATDGHANSYYRIKQANDVWPGLALDAYDKMLKQLTRADVQAAFVADEHHDPASAMHVLEDALFQATGYFNTMEWADQ
jgi:hypothetical protein